LRFGTFQQGRKTFAGAHVGRHVYSIPQCLFVMRRRPFVLRDLGAFLASGLYEPGFDWTQFKDDPRCAFPERALLVHAPIPRPPKIIAVGLNYRGHAEEQQKEPPKEPMLFAKASNCVIGPEETIRLPDGLSREVDPEVELAVVIGRACHRVSRAEARDCIFGYTILNDVSARDLQRADKQWFRAKSLPTFAPMGPVVVTADELDPSDLKLQLKVNGEVRQSASTRELIHDVPALVEFIARAFVLEPGDVIATGTPAGVGVFRDPPVFLKSGDLVEASIEGIGVLANPVR
jgi:acylpyruvate hydrolase